MTEEKTSKKWWGQKYWKAVLLILLLLTLVKGYQWWTEEEVVATSEEVAVAPKKITMTSSTQEEEKDPSPEKVVIIRNNCNCKGVLFYERNVPQKGMLMIYQGQYEGKHVFSSGPMKVPGYNENKNKMENCLEVKASRDDSFYESRGFQSRAFEYLLRNNEQFHEDSEYGVCNGLKFINQ